MSLTYLSPTTNSHECQSIAVNNITVYGTATGNFTSANSILQGGNAFAATETIGTTDNNDVHIIRDGTTEIVIGSGSVTIENDLTLIDHLHFNDTEVSPKQASLIAPTTLTASYTLTLPLNIPSVTSYLQSDNAGNLSFVTIPVPPPVFPSGTQVSNVSLTQAQMITFMPTNNKFVFIGSAGGNTMTLPTASSTYAIGTYFFSNEASVAVGSSNTVIGTIFTKGPNGSTPASGNASLTNVGQTIEISCTEGNSGSYQWLIVSNN